MGVKGWGDNIVPILSVGSLFLMRGQVTCGICGHAGRPVSSRSGIRMYHYYSCSSKWTSVNFATFGAKYKCPLPQMKQNVIDGEDGEPIF